MGWKFPERIPRDGEVVDYRDLNAAIQPFVEEDGRLNEHNLSDSIFAAPAKTTRGVLAEDVSWRVLHKSNIIEASDTDQGSPFEVESSLVWTAIPVDGTNTAFSFTSRGGTLVIIASLQMSIQGTPGAWGDGTLIVNNPRAEQVAHGLFGLRIDGALSTISVVGDQDTNNEGANMESGVSGYVQGVEVETSIPVGPGTHTVELLGKCEALDTASDDTAILVYTTELLVWEIR